VNTGVPLDASTLKTGALSSRPPEKTKDALLLHLGDQGLQHPRLRHQLLVGVVAGPPSVERDQVLGGLLLLGAATPQPPCTLSRRVDLEGRHALAIRVAPLQLVRCERGCWGFPGHWSVD
jgi:hypothetical protein